VLITIKEFVKDVRITTRSWIVEGLSLCVEGSRAITLFGEFKGE
jgi:hypothetical protein